MEDSLRSRVEAECCVTDRTLACSPLLTWEVSMLWSWKCPWENKIMFLCLQRFQIIKFMLCPMAALLYHVDFLNYWVSFISISDFSKENVNIGCISGYPALLQYICVALLKCVTPGRHHGRCKPGVCRGRFIV